MNFGDTTDEESCCAAAYAIISVNLRQFPRTTVPNINISWKSNKYERYESVSFIHRVYKRRILHFILKASKTQLSASFLRNLSHLRKVPLFCSAAAIALQFPKPRAHYLRLSSVELSYLVWKVLQQICFHFWKAGKNSANKYIHVLRGKVGLNGPIHYVFMSFYIVPACIISWRLLNRRQYRVK